MSFNGYYFFGYNPTFKNNKRHIPRNNFLLLCISLKHIFCSDYNFFINSYIFRFIKIYQKLSFQHFQILIHLI